MEGHISKKNFEKMIFRGSKVKIKIDPDSLSCGRAEGGVSFFSYEDVLFS